METLWLYAEDGTRHRAFVHQERIEFATFEGTGSIPGLKTVMLENGMPLNYVDDNTFKNPITHELLFRTPKGK